MIHQSRTCSRGVADPGSEPAQSAFETFAVSHEEALSKDRSGVRKATT